MLPSIVQAIAQIKRNVAERLTAASIIAACRESQYCWRERELGPAQTVWAFMLQVLHGNAACEHVVRLAQLSCTGSAYCAARARLPLAVLRLLAEQTCQAAPDRSGRAVGTVIAPSLPTARASRCRTRPPCEIISVSPVNNGLVAAFPSLTS